MSAAIPDGSVVEVKVQLSLFEPRTILIYNADRSIRIESRADQVRVTFPPGVFKMYYLARVEGGRLVMLRRIQDQPW